MMICLKKLQDSIHTLKGNIYSATETTMAVNSERNMVGYVLVMNGKWALIS